MPKRESITHSSRIVAADHFDPTRLRPVPRDFYNRNPRQVAPDLLGKVLIRREREALISGRIVETEAYLGTDDAAAHSATGKTARNAVLFGPPGYAYVYLIYGNHFCLNVSCLGEGDAGCVLIRALEPLAGIEEMGHLRGLNIDPAKHLRLLSSGPGRLAQALGITRPRDNGKDLADATSDLRIAEDGFVPAGIAATPRVGITKAAEHPLRYVIRGNPFVSGNAVPL
ncbi:MAG TPA: DNA-3-methyladenine glycosylase [Terriglobales bacterium]|nr:DNA-3-methyladenine glycosylase [Terriglobales bacterium]